MLRRTVRALGIGAGYLLLNLAAWILAALAFAFAAVLLAALA